jgi:uncharacterized membrane protein YeaQ/YmgE (transglycosylase-associated protein family)
MFSWIYFLLIGLAAGWLAGKIMTGHSFGIAVNLAVGVVGAVLGGLVFHVVGLAATGLLGSLICATVGAILLLFLLQKLMK